ncbi:MAG: ribosomal RNA small subunit methyltransferase A [Acidimicrobiia bacterium]
MPGRSPTSRSGRLGQHFLGNPQLAARLVADADVGPDDRVVDLGAGTGVLTAALAARAAAVLAVEIDDALATRLARRFAHVSNVTVLGCDARAVPLPRNPYRVVANPPFAATAAILRRLLDDPGGALVRADLVVQWQVARHRAQVSAGAPADVVGATWGPWWRFSRGRRLPAASFQPRPNVDAAVLVITRQTPALVPPADFARYAAWVRRQFGRRRDATSIAPADWAATFLTRP